MQRPTGKKLGSKTSTDPCFCPEAVNLKTEKIKERERRWGKEREEKREVRRE